MSRFNDIQFIENIVSPWADFDPKGHWFTVNDPHGFYKALRELVLADIRAAEIKAYRSVPQVDVDLEKWLWDKIDQLESEASHEN